ncbi:MAG: hypothetical protein N3B16_02780 [Candidatus Aminicenantes bacterium]|nr:hypothetical protein [Candidatus Aminicenantes bacterium]
MPIYEFICRQCQSRFECLTKIGGEKDVICPFCQSTNIFKIFSSFGIGGSSNRLKATTSSGCSTCSTRSCSTCR